MNGDGVGSYDELRAGFTAAVSHELRTPLARVLSLLESALLPGEDAASLVTRARDEVSELSHLVDEVLFLSELEGEDIVVRGTTRVAEVAAQVLSELRERAERADVELRADVAPHLVLPLRRRLVRVIVENLAENAVRYAGPGSVFTLTADDHNGGGVVLVGRDDGVGVARGDLPRLFERFFRADRARSTRGTGLGLAIVKHVVNAAGGTVSAESPGQGLVVRCEFPRV